MVGINVEGFFWENEEPPGGGGGTFKFLWPTLENSGRKGYLF